MKSTTTITCHNCGSLHEIRYSDFRRRLLAGQQNFYCSSRVCANKFRKTELERKVCVVCSSSFYGDRLTCSADCLSKSSILNLTAPRYEKKSTA